jgi:hypothetical protein
MLNDVLAVCVAGTDVLPLSGALHEAGSRRQRRAIFCTMT